MNNGALKHRPAQYQAELDKLGAETHARAIIDHITANVPAVEGELLTMAEVADILRTPVATLRYCRHLGTGPHTFRLGRTVRYRHPDITTWLIQQSSASAQSQTWAGDEARRRPRWGAGSGTVFERYLPRVWPPENPANWPSKEEDKTFGGTCPDQRKDQRTPWGVRAWGDEVGDVAAP